MSPPDLAVPPLSDLSPPITGRVLYVDKASLGGSSSDTNSGISIERPLCSIGKANELAVEGDTVMIRAGTYAEKIEPDNSGSEGKPITYRPFGSETVTLSGVRPSISLIGKSHIIVDGIDIYTLSCGGYCFVLLDNSHDVTVQNGTFSADSNQTSSPIGIRLRNSSHHNRFLNLHAGNVGYSNSQDNGGVLQIGTGDNLSDASHHNLFEGNTFFHGGHHVLDIDSSYNVVRNNIFHNENWMTCPKTATNGRCGNRNIIFDGDPRIAKRNLIEGNRLAYSGSPTDAAASSSFGLRTPYNIVRRNMIYYSDGAGMEIGSYTYWPTDPGKNYIYHNAFLHNGFHQDGGSVERWESGISVAHYGGTVIAGLMIKNNIFFQNQTVPISFYYSRSDLQTLDGNWLTGDPLWLSSVASPETPASWSAPDFRLQPASPVADRAAFLTTVRTSNTSNEIPVQDAAYFTDGFEVIEGDLIQLQGQTAPLRISKVDYDANVLTVDRAVTFTAGQGVAQPFVGTKPDPGPFER